MKNMKHEKFRYSSLEDVRKAAAEMGTAFPLSENTGVLSKPLSFGKVTVPNRIALQPMEGCDGTADGAPDELTSRRYRRFASGGAGLIWGEATAVVPEGRANPRQLMITEHNLDSFKRLVSDMRETALKECGIEPVLVLQLTHSGRYSKPEGVPAPLIARNNPLFEAEPLGEDRIVSDAYLESLPEKYAKSAYLATEAGFDGVDIKACHGYLMNELLASHTRPGAFGGSFENRTRLFLDCIDAARAATGAFITSRMSLHDGFPLPYGWGVGEDGQPDSGEPSALVGKLVEKGVQLIDFTIGNPYVNPHVNRPYDNGPYEPDEHPFTGLARMAGCIAAVKQRFPELCVIGSGYSYLRQFSVHFAAGAVEAGQADMAGFGRMSFAYPAFAKDVLQKGEIDKARCCIACGKCSELMRAGTVSGCVIRDSEVYLPIYNRDVKRV